jgi:membrane protease YdiL (CAAX protease family)
MGLVFGALYLRTRRLLPLITAHVIIDTVAFVGYPLALEWFPDVFA